MQASELTSSIKRIKNNLANKGISASSADIRNYVDTLHNYSRKDEQSVIEHFTKGTNAMTTTSAAIEVINDAVIETEEVTDMEPIQEQQTPMNTESALSTVTADPQAVQMVQFKASAMNIQLANEQLEFIASRLDMEATSFSDLLANAEAAIVDYFQSQEYKEYSEVNAMLGRVNDLMIKKQQNVGNAFASGVNELARVMEVAQQEQKSAIDSFAQRLKQRSTDSKARAAKLAN